MIKLTKQTIVNPNFSIVLPGECNAKCDFCFWKRSKSESPMFVTQLSWWLNEFKQSQNPITQISITGGEPTISPVFDDVMGLLEEYSDVKVVLTTNGTNLGKKIATIEGIINHINISRHAVDEATNQKLFGTKHVPDVKQLTELCSGANSSNIDVTLNRVVSGNYANLQDFDDYIGLAKTVGASAVCYRKDYSDNTLNPIALEQMLDSRKQSFGCPVCVTNSYIYKGMRVNFKMSLEEPSTAVPYIYEFVYQPDGSLTEDWAGKKKIEVQYQNAATKQQQQKKIGKIHSQVSPGDGCYATLGSCFSYLKPKSKKSIHPSGSCGSAGGSAGGSCGGGGCGS